MKTGTSLAFLRILGLTAAVSLCVTIAQANSVSFTTSGAFNGGGNSIQFGSGGNPLSITFTGMNTVSLNDSPFTFSSLGQFQSTTAGTGATITSGTPFSLTIDQTQPSSGTGFFS